MSGEERLSSCEGCADLAERSGQLEESLARTSEELQQTQRLLVDRSGELLRVKAELSDLLRQVVLAQQAEIEELKGQTVG